MRTYGEIFSRNISIKYVFFLAVVSACVVRMTSVRKHHHQWRNAATMTHRFGDRAAIFRRLMKSLFWNQRNEVIALNDIARAIEASIDYHFIHLCRLRSNNEIVPESYRRPTSWSWPMAMDGSSAASRYAKRTLRRSINYRSACTHRCSLHATLANGWYLCALGRIQFPDVQRDACQRLPCGRHSCASGFRYNHLWKWYCCAEIAPGIGVQFVHMAGMHATQRWDVGRVDGDCHRMGHTVLRRSGVGCVDGGIFASLGAGELQRRFRTSHTGHGHLCGSTGRRTRLLSGELDQMHPSYDLP